MVQLHFLLQLFCIRSSDAKPIRYYSVPAPGQKTISWLRLLVKKLKQIHLIFLTTLLMSKHKKLKVVLKLFLLPKNIRIIKVKILLKTIDTGT